jgi:hypothetical protein
MRQNACIFQSFTTPTLFVLVAILTSCKDTPTQPEYPLLTISQYNDISISFVAFDSIRVTHLAGTTFRSIDCASIAVGTKDSGMFRQLLSVPSVFNSSTCEYTFNYDFSVALNPYSIQSVLSIRYYSRDSSFAEVNTLVSQFGYPYPNTSVVVTNSIMIHPGTFQDMDRSGNTIYFHPTGAEGLYSHDLQTGLTTLLMTYYAGDFIAADSDYVFCDDQHHTIRRFNMLTKTVDLVLPPVPSPTVIAGLACSEQSLYVLVKGEAFSLKRYSYAGALLDSIPYTRTTDALAIKDSIAYSVSVSPSLCITRFSLHTRAFLPDLVAPARWLNGIKVQGDDLYFCSTGKDFIGRVPLSTLVPR